ncbi:hypothetical protein NY2A_b856R [Paramecium bursaria Chlorella virus NY2A]|uniref:Uncharacterized protein b856R n=1 Tax=Paramecium bursaria Chlorella virus NY2A TaxID=46021 RepID=A7IY31_PBCVN|nr:hypothetical protein NY2A_b856R [Paramecium bursaria Chlorella virus NY2A]ABT15255.1 hypothetical protein NY2A_b856R [Paramecium bursaria Chlorella virus NY2A]
MIMFDTLFHDVLKRCRKIACGEFESDRCRFRRRKILGCKCNRTRCVFARELYQRIHHYYVKKILVKLLLFGFLNHTAIFLR